MLPATPIVVSESVPGYACVNQALTFRMEMLLIANHFEELVAFLLAVVAASVVVSLPIRPAVLGCIHKHQSPGTH